MNKTENKQILEYVSGIWECIKVPLKKHGLPWADQKNRTTKNPIRVSVENGLGTVEIDTEHLANDPNIAWQALCDMEVTLYKKYGDLKLYFYYDFRYINFPVTK